MKTFLLMLMLIFTLALAVGGLGCGSSDPEPGTSCASSDECGTLTCYCPLDPVPGTCSKECSTDADCAALGEGQKCVDFGSEGTCGPFKICLRSN
jgi:hypothetical protein